MVDVFYQSGVRFSEHSIFHLYRFLRNGRQRSRGTKEHGIYGIFVDVPYYCRWNYHFTVPAFLEVHVEQGNLKSS